MYHSYVMGIDESIYTLEEQGFEINRDGGNFMVSFPKEKAVIWDEPVEEFTGVIVAIIHRCDDAEEKWVVAPENVSFTVEDIEKQVHFQEQYFKTCKYICR